MFTTALDDAVDEATDQWGDVAGGLAVPPAVAALTMFLGSSFAIVAVIGWAQSGASDAPRVVEMVCSWYKRGYHQYIYSLVAKETIRWITPDSPFPCIDTLPTFFRRFKTRWKCFSLVASFVEGCSKYSKNSVKCRVPLYLFSNLPKPTSTDCSRLPPDCLASSPRSSFSN